MLLSSSIDSLNSWFSVSGSVNTSMHANIAAPPQIVVGINHLSEPKKSTIYGAEIEPTCDIVELVPIAEFRIFVGNNSAVCKITTANAELMHKRPNRAVAIIAVPFSINIEKLLINV